MSENPIHNPFDEEDRNPQGLGEDVPSHMRYDANLNPMDQGDDSENTLRILLLLVGAGGCCIVLTAAAFFFFRPDLDSTIARYFPSSTPTQNLTATAAGFQAEAASAVDEWLLLVSEQFDHSNNPRWYTGTDDTRWAKVIFEVSDGKYRWNATAHEGFIQWIRLDEKPLADFYVTAETQETGNPAIGDSGILFREDRFHNYYYFGVDSRGSFFVGLYYKEKWNDMISWTSSPLILSDQPNRLTVVGNGSHFTFFINDQYVGEMTDDHLAEGTIGMAIGLHEANDQSVFEFDNVELRAPAPPATSTPTVRPTATMTYTPTITLTPHVLIPAPEDAKVFIDQFESNRNGWVRHNSRASIVSVKDGKLIVRSDKIGSYGVASCIGCPVFEDAYYFQAEFATSADTSAWHGPLFCAHPDRLTGYYMILIDSQNQFYTLQKNSDEGWSTLVQPNRSRIINQFPLSNTLAVLYNHGKIDMYINGAFVHTYTPADELRCRNVGFMVQEGQIDMIVDNVFAYPIDVTATPNP